MTNPRPRRPAGGRPFKPGKGGKRPSGPPRRPPTRRPPVVDEARQAALDVLGAVRARGAYANLALPPILRDRGLYGRDAALATELTYGTCRALGQLDAIIGACGDRAFEELDGVVIDALRLGAYQLLHTRIPPHAAVSSVVELVRAGERPGAAGYVNAVLRRIAEADLETWIDRIAPPVSTDPLGRLAMATAHPRWIVAAYRDRLAADPPDGTGPSGPESSEGPPPVASAGAAAHAENRTGTEAEIRVDPVAGTRVDAGGGDDVGGGSGAPSGAEPTSELTPEPTSEPAPEPPAEDGAGEPDGELVAALRADDAPPAVHLVARPGRIGRDELVEQSGGVPARYSPYGVYLTGGDPGAIAAVADGRAAVQDEGSQLVAVAVATADLTGSDERWLDLTAGPGGKAGLLGALAALRGARLDAVEQSPHRADLVRRTTEGLPVTVLTADGRDSGLPLAAYDRVLLDAPCTGLGALRRRPEARWRRRPSDVADLVELQQQLLRAAAGHARVGGVIGYVTCSPHLAETLGVIGRAPDGLDILDARPLLPGVPDLGTGPTVQLWPHRQGTDGMFLALFRRTG